VTREVILSALHDVEELKKKLQALLTLEEAQKSRKSVLLKRENGRLTDEGVNRLRSMIDAGRTDSEIARELSISPTATYHQRQKYLAEKAGARRRVGK
jgi:hypothetical protein